jgi:hypothetical protein
MGRALRRLLVAGVLYPPATVLLLCVATAPTDGRIRPGHLPVLEWVAPAAATVAVAWAVRPAAVGGWLGVAGFAAWALAVGQAWRAFTISMWDTC